MEVLSVSEEPVVTLMTYPADWYHPDYKPPPLDPAIVDGTCLICSLKDEHSSLKCPYRKYIPKNATISRSYIVCTICGSLYSGRCCNQDAACAKLKSCDNCHMYGDHWESQCPKKDTSLTDVDF